MKDYNKLTAYRDFTKEELDATATGTALIIDDGDFGSVAIIPTKNKRYLQLWLSTAVKKDFHPGDVLMLNKFHIRIVNEEIFLDY